MNINTIRTLTVDLTYTEFHLLQQAIRDKQFHILDCLTEVEEDDVIADVLMMRLKSFQAMYVKMQHAAPDYLNGEV
jgi:hypothetical protein